jgi:hypothetical protein
LVRRVPTPGINAGVSQATNVIAASAAVVEERPVWCEQLVRKREADGPR